MWNKIQQIHQKGIGGIFIRSFPSTPISQIDELGNKQASLKKRKSDDKTAEKSSLKEKRKKPLLQAKNPKDGIKDIARHKKEIKPKKKLSQSVILSEKKDIFS